MPALSISCATGGAGAPLEEIHRVDGVTLVLAATLLPDGRVLVLGASTELYLVRPAARTTRSGGSRS
jgi:hypothetical protein